jgi:hypothetical protein
MLNPTEKLSPGTDFKGPYGDDIAFPMDTLQGYIVYALVEDECNIDEEKKKCLALRSETARKNSPETAVEKARPYYVAEDVENKDHLHRLGLEILQGHYTA